jgi:hypothetical protein
MGFEVLTAASMRMAVFWVVAPYSLVEVYRRFRGACCLHHNGDEAALMMEAASTSETLVNFCQTTRRNNPEDSHLHRVGMPIRHPTDSYICHILSARVLFVTLMMEAVIFSETSINIHLITRSRRQPSLVSSP